MDPKQFAGITLHRVLFCWRGVCRNKERPARQERETDTAFSQQNSRRKGVEILLSLRMHPGKFLNRQVVLKDAGFMSVVLETPVVYIVYENEIFF